MYVTRSYVQLNSESKQIADTQRWLVREDGGMDGSFEYAFPAIRGVQAGREYYVSMCPLRVLPRLFHYNDEELSPELRAQRTLNKARIPEIARYVLNNRNDYVFSAITASIDAEVRFEQTGTERDNQRLGILRIPMTARLILNDGQHRRAAIETALRENPDLADETIAVVMFLDLGLERCQQMFADLNRYAVRPSKSLGVLYDHRDDQARLARLVVAKSPVFNDIVEMERSSLSLRSRKLFTLSSIYSATKALLAGHENGSLDEDASLSASFWNEVATHVPEWNAVRAGTKQAGEVRQDFLHSHGTTLQALGHVGNSLLQRHKASWRKQLKGLDGIDWRRSNAKLWEGRAMIGGRVSKASHNVTLTANVIAKQLKLPLSPEHQRAEDAYLRGDYGR